ncbi:TolC family outer membrane protein [Exilibacterium tricleocarpae]|uniref:TolC family outer membrane protein n=2 Tax=Exilibacterium tricleocarpae TaxID=2591008 RepID=A0A545U703_9GAMM|nr:TolC family outer membrane protein [Exilibacterium tricleocarpae]
MVVFLTCLGHIHGYAMTLEEAVQRTLDSHPEILAARQQLASRREEIGQARAGYLPDLDLAAGIGREESRSPVTDDEKVRLTRQEASIQARQLVFDGFATRSEVERQEARTDSSLHAARAASENIALRTTEVYLNVLRRDELRKLALETLYQHQNIHDQMVLRNRSGVGSKADLDQITARLALAHSNAIAAQNNLLDARTNFFRVIGALPDVADLSKPSIEQALPGSLEAALQKATDNHPTLMSANADIDAAEAQYQASKSTFWPRLQLEAEKNFDQDIGGVEGDDEALIVALRLRYNLYNGGGDSARRRQTAHLREEAREIRNNTRRQVVESARLSWSAYQAVTEQMKYLELHVKAALDTKSAYTKQFNIGKRTLLDLLNTENELVEAKRALVEAGYDKLFAQYRIYNAMGELLDNIGS